MNMTDKPIKTDLPDQNYIPIPGTLERYAEVYGVASHDKRPVVWGRYRMGSTAAARANKLARHPNNDAFGLRFAQRTFLDDVYIIAYLEDEDLDKMHVAMTYDQWLTIHGFPDDLKEAGLRG
ncbi:hypothetical protein FGG65_gp54 [Corynebacterium phage phi673]|uniref:Uncharacterized protein n=1 Tax=Corynebacterium phage phi673 TaxID=2052821 RepID=A0A2H4PIY5_9CAUD|nr:hypothetical protein FGG65_gp54 [Corynebacterium phage phi673]ATW62916.1 hypothetical protein phi673_gp54 [Corynebacterium phage phi673]